MDCSRCGGFMVEDKIYTPVNEKSQVYTHFWRCIQCGDMIDSTILKNRNNPLPETTKRGVRKWN